MTLTSVVPPRSVVSQTSIVNVTSVLKLSRVVTVRVCDCDECCTWQ